jgi:hypothetical protein
LILFDQSAREGLIRFPSFSGYKNNIVIKESGAEDGTLNTWRICPSSRPVAGTSEAGKRGEE